MKLRKKHIITFSCFGLVAAIFTLFTQFLPGGEIYLAHSKSEQLHTVEVKAKDLASPFFGTSFHLTYNQDQYEYDHFSLGSFFAESDPLVQVAPRDNSIITGISLKRGSLIKKSEGSIIKLFFKTKQTNPPTSSFSLTNTVYSTYDNGRKNIPSVKFSNNAITN
jgi:Cohesin domain